MRSPSSTSTLSALAHVCRACPDCWLRVVIDGVGDPGGYFPSAIALRRSAARRTYALGSDSSPIDILVPYSIGKVANRNVSTVVDHLRDAVSSVACTYGVCSAMTSWRDRPPPASAPTRSGGIFWEGLTRTLDPSEIYRITDLPSWITREFTGGG